MARSRRLPLVSVIIFVFMWLAAGVITASDGDADPIYLDCVERGEKTGCVGHVLLRFLDGNMNVTSSDPWYQQEPLYIKWKKWDCLSGYRYQCMLVREEERAKAGETPVKYHGKWPLKRAFGIEEPVAVALSAINLALQFHGWVSFFILVNYAMPASQTYYEYTGLWHIYGALSMNFLFWSVVYHSRDVEMTEKLHYSSAASILGFSTIVAILRAFNVTSEATRVMVAAPLTAFVTTHILYLNCYQFDYGLHVKVCLTMAVAQLLVWVVWASVSNHPSRWKIRLVAVGECLIIFLQIYDFTPFGGVLDAHGISHAIAIPLSYISWGFIYDDNGYQKMALQKKGK